MSGRLQSPLLDLPAEIRTEIWKYLLGVRQINVTYCLNPFGDIIAPHNNHLLVESVTNRPASNDITIMRQTTQEFHLRESQNRGSCEEPNLLEEKFSLSLLQVNHQIHNEGTFVFYSTNIFSFCHETQLCKWLSRLTIRQCSLVKAIGIFNRWGCLIVKELNQLPALDTIHLSIWNLSHGHFRDLDGMKESVKCEFDGLEKLVTWQGLKLKKIPISVHMIVRNRNHERREEMLDQIKHFLETRRDELLRRLIPGGCNEQSGLEVDLWDDEEGGEDDNEG